MLNVTCADCRLCWLSLMLNVAYAECCLCWMSLMLNVAYDECCLCWMLHMLNTIHAECGIFNCYTECLFVEWHNAEYRYAMCHLRWVSCILLLCWVWVFNCFSFMSFVLCVVFLWWKSSCWVSFCWMSWRHSGYSHALPLGRALSMVEHWPLIHSFNISPSQ